MDLDPQELKMPYQYSPFSSLAELLSRIIQLIGMMPLVRGGNLWRLQWELWNITTNLYQYHKQRYPSHRPGGNKCTERNYVFSLTVQLMPQPSTGSVREVYKCGSGFKFFRKKRLILSLIRVHTAAVNCAETRQHTYKQSVQLTLCVYYLSLAPSPSLCV